MDAPGRSLTIALALLALAPAAAGAADGKIVFQSARDLDYELYAMDGDGSDVRRLTRSPGWDQWPAWSPDGQRIAFTSRHGDADDIYVMGAAGGAAARVTQGRSPFSFNTRAEWAPDGGSLLYTSNDGTSHAADVFRVGADGTGAGQLLPLPARSGDAVPSPDGSRIAFSSTGGGDPWKDGDLFLAAPDGSGAVRLTDTPEVIESAPAWSPDGTRLAFQSYQGGSTHIELIDADGSDRRALTRGPLDQAPAWSPAGDRLLFDGKDGTTAQLFVVPAAGGPVRQLTYGLDYRHNVNGDWSAGSVPDAPAGRLRTLRAGTTRRHVKVAFTLTAPGRIRFAVHRCTAGSGACRPGRQVFQGRMDGGDEPTELWLTELPAAGRYRVAATVAGATRTATTRAD